MYDRGIAGPNYQYEAKIIGYIPITLLDKSFQYLYYKRDRDLFPHAAGELIVAKCNENEEYPYGFFMENKDGEWYGLGNYQKLFDADGYTIGPFNTGKLDIDGNMTMQWENDYKNLN